MFIDKSTSAFITLRRRNAWLKSNTENDNIYFLHVFRLCYVEMQSPLTLITEFPTINDVLTSFTERVDKCDVDPWDICFLEKVDLLTRLYYNIKDENTLTSVESV